MSAPSAPIYDEASLICMSAFDAPSPSETAPLQSLKYELFNENLLSLTLSILCCKPNGQRVELDIPPSLNSLHFLIASLVQMQQPSFSGCIINSIRKPLLQRFVFGKVILYPMTPDARFRCSLGVKESIFNTQLDCIEAEGQERVIHRVINRLMEAPKYK